MWTLSGVLPLQTNATCAPSGEKAASLSWGRPLSGAMRISDQVGADLARMEKNQIPAAAMASRKIPRKERRRGERRKEERRFGDGSSEVGEAAGAVEGVALFCSVGLLAPFGLETG